MTTPEPTVGPAVPPLWWSPSRGLIEQFIEGEGAYYQARGRTARPELPADAVRLAALEEARPDVVKLLKETWDEAERLRVERVDILVLLDDVLEDLAHAIPYAGEFRRRRALLSPAPTSGVADD